MIILILIGIAILHSVPANALFTSMNYITTTNAEKSLFDIQNVMFVLVNKILRNHHEVSNHHKCDLVLIYDELLTIPINMMDIWENSEINSLPLLITLNLSNHSLQAQQLKSNSEIISKNSSFTHNPKYTYLDLVGLKLAKFLHSIYRIENCFIFLTWMQDPRILYPINLNIHPGWRTQDYVIVTLHHLKIQEHPEIRKYRFWKEIPNIIGLKFTHRVSNLINIFTVEPYTKYVASNANNNNSTNSSSARSFEIDIWNVKQGQFNSPNANLFWDKFKNLHNQSINVGCSWKEPFLIMGDIEAPYFDGLDWRLLQLVSKQLNFAAKWHFVTSTGTRSEINGSWSGLMGEIELGKLDFGIGGISVSPKRLQDFGFCRTYWSDSYTFISPLNKSDLNTIDSLVRPLSLTVWIFTGLSALVATLAMKLFAIFEADLLPSTGRNLNIKNANSKLKYSKDNWFSSISNNIYVLWSLFLQKSFRHVPKSDSVRIIYISMSFTFFILGIIFAGGLYAHLLEKRGDISVDRTKYIRRSGLKIFARNYDGHLNDFIQTSSRKRLRSLWNNHTITIQANESYKTIAEVVLGHGILIDSRSKLTFIGKYNYAGINGFKFHMSSQDILNVNVGWPIRQNWPIKHKIDDILIRVVESGIVQFWMNQFSRGKIGWDNEAYRLIRPGVNTSSFLHPRENSTKSIDPSVFDRNYDRLKMEHFGGVLLMWLIGLIFSTLVFISEIITCCTITTSQVLTSLCKCFIKFITIGVWDNFHNNAIKKKKGNMNNDINLKLKKKFGKKQIKQFNAKEKRKLDMEFKARRIIVKTIDLENEIKEIIW